MVANRQTDKETDKQRCKHYIHQKRRNDNSKT